VDVLTDDGPILVPVPEGRLDEDHARALDERIRLTAGTVRERMTRLAGLVEQAKAGEVWDVLGFPSWTAYLADALGGELHLPSGERRELVGLLAGEGMSTRAIAPIVGASPRTVARDVETLELPGVPSGTPEVREGEINGRKVEIVTGLDGKSYVRKPRKPEQPADQQREWPDLPGWVSEGDRWRRCGTCGFCACTPRDMRLHHQWHAERGRKPEQLTVPGTEPERMVPSLPGLGVTVQSTTGLWFTAFTDWWHGAGQVSARGAKRVAVAEDAFRAGWLAATAAAGR
jgi:DNA-binding Lrp family transcriptional regulator